MLNSRCRKSTGQCGRMHSPAFLSTLRGEMERPDPPRPGVPLFGLLLAAPFPSNPRRKPLPCGRRQPFHLRNEVPATFRSRNELLRRASLRRSEEHTSELQSLMRISYAVFCLKKKTQTQTLLAYYSTRSSVIYV